MQTIQIQKYIGEAANTIQETVNQHDRITFIAPTGSGKSSTIFSKDYGTPIFQLLNGKHGDNHITIMIETTTIKQEKDNHTYEHINLFCGRKGVSVPDIKKLMNGKLEYSYQDKVIVTNYSYVKKIIEVLKEMRIDYSLIFDEIHTLFLYDYKNKQLKKLSKTIKSYPPKSIINLSATMEKSFLRKNKICEFIREENKTIKVNLDKMGNRNFSQSIIEFCEKYFRGVNSREDDRILFIFFNNIKELNTVEKEAGRLAGNSVTAPIILTSNHKHEPYFQRIINAGSEEESFDKRVKIVLTTSISEDSIDFFTSRPVTILNVVPEEYFLNVYGLKQFCGRFRNTPELDLNIIIKKSGDSDNDEIGERYGMECSPELLQKLYDGNYNWFRKLEVDKQLQLRDKRLEQANMIITDDMTEKEKESLRKFYTRGLDDNSNSLMTDWLAAQKTHKHMVNKVIGITNLKSELIRQFGDTIKIVQDNLQVEETPMPKGNLLTKLGKEREREIGEKINQCFSIQTIEELIKLRESNWEHEFEEYEDYKPILAIRRELTTQFPDLSKEEIKDKADQIKLDNKTWLTHISDEVSKKYIIDFLDAYKVISELPMDFDIQTLKKLLISKNRVKINRYVDGTESKRTILGLVRRKSDVKKDINKLCIKDIVKRFASTSNNNHSKIYDEYPALPIELCDLTVLSEWVKSIDSGDIFINDDDVVNNAFYLDNHRELRNLYGELKNLNLKMDITRSKTRIMILHWVTDCRRSNYKKHKVYKVD